ncbi:MAG: cob(I)yrinic acid a,c-diamide adenosyltransferase [Chloroflexi bacterium]|nr:cob(I)yrinic acid a,c-diamide adenosyltransferase [Chloroflexota bacterium]
MVRIYTRRGDTGETGLLYGGRVSKADPRCEAYGTLDEANAALGMARALSQDTRMKAALLQVQRELFTVGAELATAPADYDDLRRHFSVVTPDMVERLERIIDELDEVVQLPRSFVIPGASGASAALDLARTILRRAERRTVELKEAGLLANLEVLRYLNRLSDLVFMLARYEDRALPKELLTGEGTAPPSA